MNEIHGRKQSGGHAASPDADPRALSTQAPPEAWGDEDVLGARGEKQIQEGDMGPYAMASPAAETRRVSETPGWIPRQRSSTEMRWRDRLILDTLKTVLKHKVLCLAVVLVAGSVGWFATMMMTPYYVAQARIYPPMTENPLGGLGIPGMANLLGNLGMPPGAGSQFPLYEKVLYSRDLLLKLLTVSLSEAGVAGTLQDHLDVAASNPAEREAISVEILRAKISYEMETQTSVATIAVRDQDPRIAAVLVNSCVNLLNEFDISTSTTAARERRRFVESRLEEASRSLIEAERDLETFRAENMRIGNAPHLLLEQARLQRELEIEQQVYLTLRTQAELAQIEENRSVPVVNVLESAVPPLYPAGPSKIRNAIMAAALAGLFTLGFFTIRAAQPRSLMEHAGLIPVRR